MAVAIEPDGLAALHVAATNMMNVRDKPQQ